MSNDITTMSQFGLERQPTLQDFFDHGFENEGGDCEPMVLTDGWHPEAHLVISNIHQTPTT